MFRCHTVLFGFSWKHIGVENADIRSISVKNNLIFAGSLFGGAYYSDDSGKTWQDKNIGISNAYVNTITSTSEGLWAGTVDLGIYHSADNGKNWIMKGIEDKSINSILVKDDNIFVATNEGLYHFQNSGNQWSKIVNGINNTNIKKIFAYNNILYAATYGNGVYNSLDNGKSWIKTNTGEAEKYAQCLSSAGSTIFLGSQKRYIQNRR